MSTVSVTKGVSFYEVPLYTIIYNIVQVYVSIILYKYYSLLFVVLNDVTCTKYFKP